MTLFIILGNYSFKIISFNTLFALLQWFAFPVVFIFFCQWQIKVFLQETAGSNSTQNMTSNNRNAIDLAGYSSLTLEMVSIFMAPITLGRLFDSQKNVAKNKCLPLVHKHFWILTLAIGSQLAAYTLNMSLACFSRFPLLGLRNIIIFNLLPNTTFWGSYLFLRFSTLFLPVTLLTALTDKCLNADEAALVDEVKICLRDYSCLKSNIGSLLLIFMSIDSLFVMLNSFMSYMALTLESYAHLVVFILLDMAGILSLIYICLHCDQCFKAMKSLLIPLRYIIKNIVSFKKHYFECLLFIGLLL